MKTFILIFWIGQGAGSAEFFTRAACLEAHKTLKETYSFMYGGVCVSKGTINDK
jgi:pyruvate/2-oxoglutarate dehydrogenase complex dihydrolipoamide dehydrogenase (E3) component